MFVNNVLESTIKFGAGVVLRLCRKQTCFQNKFGIEKYPPYFGSKISFLFCFKVGDEKNVLNVYTCFFRHLPACPICWKGKQETRAQQSSLRYEKPVAIHGIGNIIGRGSTINRALDGSTYPD